MTKDEEKKLAKAERAKLLKHYNRHKGSMMEFAALYGVTTSRIYARLRQARKENEPR